MQIEEGGHHMPVLNHDGIMDFSSKPTYYQESKNAQTPTDYMSYKENESQI